MRVLTSTHARFASSTLASFDSRVGSAPLACTCTCLQMILACGIASDASCSHSHVKLRPRGTVHTKRMISFCRCSFSGLQWRASHDCRAMAPNVSQTPFQPPLYAYLMRPRPSPSYGARENGMPLCEVNQPGRYLGNGGSEGIRDME